MKCFEFSHGELYFYLKGESMTLINEAAKDIAHYYGMEPEDFTMTETDYNDESVLPVEQEFKKGCWPTNSFTIFDCDYASNRWETQWPSWDNVPKGCPKMTINKDTSLHKAVCWAIGMVSPTTPWYRGNEDLGKAVVACLSDALNYLFTKAEAEVIKEYVWHADTYEEDGLGDTPLKYLLTEV